MRHRKIATLMTTDVAVVRPDTPFKQITQLLEQRGISGVPVVDAGYQVLGVVSAADLLPKGSRYEPPGQHKVTRLPVVNGDGTLAGIVGRGDLLRVFLQPDTAIAAEIRHEVFERELGVGVTPASVSVLVHDGVATLAGQLEYRSQIPAAVALARRVDGVIAVVDELTWHIDDRHDRLVPPDTADAIGTIRRASR